MGIQCTCYQTPESLFIPYARGMFPIDNVREGSRLFQVDLCEMLRGGFLERRPAFRI